MSPPDPPRTGMARAIARLDAAMGPGYSSRAMSRALGASEASIRRWRSNWPVAEAAVLALSKALGLDPAQVRGYAPLPEEWPPAFLLASLERERRALGRKPNQPAEPPPTAPPEMHRLVQELRELMAAMRGGVATERRVPHASTKTKVGLAGDDSVATAEQMAALAERLEALAEMLAAHDAAALGLWEAAVEERRAIVERLERIERILSRPLFECDDGPAPNGDDAG